jgi:hypothetical protein
MVGTSATVSRFARKRAISLRNACTVRAIFGGFAIIHPQHFAARGGRLRALVI